MSDQDKQDFSGIIRMLGPGLAELFSGRQIELEHVELELGELELWLPLGGIVPAGIHPPLKGDVMPDGKPSLTVLPRPEDLIVEQFRIEPDVFPSQIREVTLGATKTEGGTRARTVTVGGSTSIPFTHPDSPPVHPPVISLDVFDTRVPMPKALKSHLTDVIDDPAAWARMNVEQFGADMVTVHLLSTDPLIQNRSPREASRTVEEVLQAVDVPLIIGGCGDPKKDAETFTEIAAMAEGERLLLNSVTSDMADAKTLEPVCKAADKHGHCLLAFTGLDLNSAKELNRRIYQYFPPERLLIDLTTVALGYGLEYSFSIHERARFAALMGDMELSHPTISACTNAWSAREAWMDLGPEFGKNDLRGPLWETIGGLTLLLAGVDIFLMMHPLAVTTLREVAGRLMRKTDEKEGCADWVSIPM
ncbi:MAG TPA: CO dehydrogenase/acetyl-CoA synthase subunit delta [Methanospirillum sp.]|uniref:CO dehydrogenase/acetyl-CoA synthase subunit delta n=1 Tax=Methanospirillum sp. TaxID=45200 RepID=UPI002C7A1828|nr:CO dehydrogenase/acetyl-CoA synthase subunit delta [Methanospirillum sp.]HOJ95314.1 CO dehydrogenase/acetyl-CoA synthase subunit delta [Methanospirillum sp.]HOL41071.1 CO dehydrogenase/acetyl-CoA synthase subunit delta [Methanospirillum sp.]HPP76997.1 CO dehydrogenase/acetyl-CoA synthase subunit delta [Methanospirillum sp.]